LAIATGTRLLQESVANVGANQAKGADGLIQSALLTEGYCLM